jgi:hypothetical protein
MDSPGSSLDQNVDLSKLSDKDKAELQQFVVNESQKARIQQSTFASLAKHLFPSFQDMLFVQKYMTNVNGVRSGS